MVIIASLFYIIVFLALAYHYANTEASFSTVTVFGLAAFLYYIAIPLEMSARGLDFFIISGIPIGVPAIVQLQIVAMGTIALVAFTAGYHATGFAPFAVSHPADGGALIGRPEAVARPIYWLGGTCLLALLTFYRYELGVVGTYQGNYSIAYSSPLFSFFIELLVTSLALAAGVLGCREANKRPAISFMLILPVIGWSIYSSDKDPMLLGLLGGGAFFVQQRRKHQMRVIAGIVAACALSGPLVGLFSAYRAEGTLVVDDFKIHSLMLERDPMGPMVSLTEILQDDNVEFQYGRTYFDSVTLLIPKSLWPDRPLDLSERFIRERLAGWQPGMGMGYSLMAEAFLNFGWFGCLLQYLLLGFFWGHAWRVIQRIFAPMGVGYWRAIYCTVGYYTLIMMHRAPMSFPVKHTLMTIAVLFVFSEFFGWRRTRLPRVELRQSLAGLRQGGRLS